jgi:hypothetical protein
MFDGIKNMAKEVDRDPSALELIVTAGVEFTAPIEKRTTEFTGTLEQIGEDFAAARKLGAAEITIYAQFLPSGKPPKILSLEWKLSGRTQSKLDVARRIVAGCCFIWTIRWFPRDVTL